VPTVTSAQESTSESWLVGVAAAGERLASLRVHAGFMAAGPASGRPFRAHLRFRLQDPSESGFPHDDEVAALHEAEVRVTQALDAGSVLVAVVGAPGFRDLVLHTAAPEPLRAALDRCVLVDLGYEPELDVDEDPSWSTYRALFAQAVDADYDRRLVARLASAGADLRAERSVRHHLSFASLDDAYAMLAALHAAQIEADLFAGEEPAGVADAAAQATLDAARQAGRTVVVVSEVTAVSQPVAARARAGLAELAASWGGTYLGWNADELPA
jgi:hypothetical protein